MHYNYNDCEYYVSSILHRVPILRTKTLTKALHNMCPTIKNYEEALAVLKRIQRKGYVCLSPDGFSLSRGAYISATEDNFCEHLRTKDEYAAPKMLELLNHKKLIAPSIDSFIIACDLLPESFEFVSNLTPPWDISFNYRNEENNYVYQVARVYDNSTYVFSELLKSLPIVPEPIRKGIIRVALLDNEKQTSVIPYIGVKYLCVLDDENDKGYRLVEKRGDDIRWG